MANLSNVLKFMSDTNKNLTSITGKLEKLQGYFTENFNNIVQIRDNEFDFLQEEFFKDRTNLPKEIGDSFNRGLSVQKDEFDKNYDKLQKQKEDLENRLAKIDKTRLKLLESFKRYNVNLDREEERLKVRIEKVEQKISQYNEKIDELNKGLGFMINLFNMKKLQKEKEKYIKARKGLVADIEKVRSSWQEKEMEISKDLEDLKAAWNDPHTEYSLVLEKIRYLDENRGLIIKKASFASALKELKGSEDFILSLIDSDKPEHIPQCPRCESDNKSNIFFCYYCGERFHEDRLDVQGSLVEVGELNTVFNNLLEGIRETVSFLALLKGIKQGVEAITKAYQDVKRSQDTYSALPKLKIHVPNAAKRLPQYIKQLDSRIEIEFKNLHPHEYFKQFEVYSKEYFIEKNIKIYFDSMGNELNKVTAQQWK